MNKITNDVIKQTKKSINVQTSTISYKLRFAIGLIILLTIVLMVLSVIFPFHRQRHQRQHKSHLASYQSPDYQAELKANMAKLNELKKIKRQLDKVLPRHIKQHLSKQDIARQHAPTHIYSAAVNTTQPSTNTKPTQKPQPILLGHDSNSQFINQSTQVGTISASRITHADTVIAAGELIHAVLETAIHSDLPGMVRAVVSRAVYSYVGLKPLIPAGSRLIGQYASQLLQGQKRVMIMWNRIILPNGITINIDSPATDELGQSGQLADTISTHFWSRFGHAVLLSVIGAGVANVGVESTDQPNSQSSYRQAVAQSFQQSAQGSLKQSRQINPTLTINQGALVNVFVARDLNLDNAID